MDGQSLETKLNSGYSRSPSSDDDVLRAIRAADERWLGELGESIWKRLLAAAGWHYVSLTKICEGGAPLARGKKTVLILPDFDAYRDGRAIFVEAKAKTQSIVYQNKKQERHGINENNYLHYREIERRSGKQCFIGLVELRREDRTTGELHWSGSFLIQSLANLGEPVSEYPEQPPKVYWPRSKFFELGRGLSPVELFRLAKGDAAPNYETRLNNLLSPVTQKALF